MFNTGIISFGMYVLLCAEDLLTLSDKNLTAPFIFKPSTHVTGWFF
nr:MAG TPA: hypothetical protein [Caudoviricetes sp.]